MACFSGVRPTWFFAVPRIWEKLKAAIEAGIEAEHDEPREAGHPVGARGRVQVRGEQAEEVFDDCAP